MLIFIPEGTDARQGIINWEKEVILYFRKRKQIDTDKHFRP
jgi:hypothetical protein